MSTVRSKCILLFIALSMLGSMKIYMRANFDWLILLALLLPVITHILLYSKLLQVLSAVAALVKFSKPMFLGLGVFMVGMAVAAFTNNGTGLYAILKYFVISSILILLIMVGISSVLLEKALILALGLALVPLIFLVAFGIHSWLIILGDGRMGWLAIWPGILWKAGAYVWPFAIWRQIREPGRINYLITFGAALAMALDGSRTSMLWLIMTLGMLFVFSYRSNFISNSVHEYSKIIVIIILAFGLVQPVMLKWASRPHDAAIEEIISDSGSLQSSSIRMLNGDTKTRYEMLQVGWRQAIAAFPLGCGFGCTAIFENGNHIVIHMTYLQILGDEGIIGLIGYLLFLLFPLFESGKYIFNGDGFLLEKIDDILAPMSILIMYLFSGLFHPLSNELTEWVIVLAAIATVTCHVTYYKK